MSDPVEVRGRFERDGYLFLRGLLPSRVLEDLRSRFVTILRAAGWIATNAPPNDPIANSSAFTVEPEPAYQAVYNQLYRVPEFHEVQHRPELTGTLEHLLGAQVMPQPRVIARVMFPDEVAHTTPAHQDFVPVQGAVDTVTAWMPLSDLPPEMGGLEIAAGSNHRGVLDFVPSLGAGGMVITDPLDDAWVGGIFEQGDVLLFHSMTVHRGAAATGKRLRLSIDCRFQRRSDPITEGSLEPHDRDVSWEQVYEGWRADTPRYYWRDWDLKIVGFDGTYNEKRDRMAFELAAKGDVTARATLSRIVARDPDPDKRKRAAGALKDLEAHT